MCRRQCELRTRRFEMVQSWGPNTLVERMATKKVQLCKPMSWNQKVFQKGHLPARAPKCFQCCWALGPPQVSVLLGSPTAFKAIMKMLLEGKLGWTWDRIWCFYYPCIWRPANCDKRSVITKQDRQKNVLIWEQLMIFKAQHGHRTQVYCGFWALAKKFNGTCTTLS